MKWRLCDSFSETPNSLARRFCLCVLGRSGRMLKHHWQLGHRVRDVPVTCSTQAPALEKKLYQCVYFPWRDLTVYNQLHSFPCSHLRLNSFPCWRDSIWCKHHLNPTSALFPELRWSWCGTLCKLSCVGVNFSIGSLDVVGLSHSSKE